MLIYGGERGIRLPRFGLLPRIPARPSSLPAASSGLILTSVRRSDGFEPLPALLLIYGGERGIRLPRFGLLPRIPARPSSLPAASSGLILTYVRRSDGFESLPALLLIYGGERGIRTLGTFYCTYDFQSYPFGHSGISPCYSTNVKILSKPLNPDYLIKHILCRMSKVFKSPGRRNGLIKRPLPLWAGAF